MRKITAIVFIALTALAWYINITALYNEPIEYKEHLQKAEEYCSKGIYVDAISEYEAALAYDDNAEIKMKLADAYLANENTSKYVSLCKEIAENNQDNTEALDCLIHYYLDQGDTKKAVQYLDEFIEKYPDNENASSWFVKLKGSYSKVYCWYSDMGEIYNGYMLISQEDLWGIADASGSEIIAPEYEYIQVFSENGYALAKSNGVYVYIDKKGQTRLVPDKEYDHLSMLSSERAVASRNGKYGLLDADMQAITDFNWDDASSIYNNIGAACLNGKWALINQDGECITDYIYDDVIKDAYGFCNKQGVIFVKSSGSYQMINEKGERVGNLEFDDAICFGGSGYAAVCSKGKWGFVDEEGNLVIDYTYEEARSFSNGFAAVKNGALWGYIDTNNNLVIDMKLYSAAPFSEQGTAVIEEEEGNKKLIKLDLLS